MTRPFWKRFLAPDGTYGGSAVIFLALLAAIILAVAHG